MHQFRIGTRAHDAVTTSQQVEDRRPSPARTRGEIPRRWPKHVRPDSPSLPQPDEDGGYDISQFNYLIGTRHLDPDSNNNEYETSHFSYQMWNNERHVVGHRYRVLGSGNRSSVEEREI